MKGYLIIVSVVTIAIPSIQHYIPPPDMCLLAKSCNHTWVPECGIDGNSSIKRLFLDICDMYEYNCDYKTEYTKIDTKDCPQNIRQSENQNNYATEHKIMAPITSTISTCITSTITIPTFPISSVTTTPLTRTPLNVETLNDTESTTSSPKTNCITNLSNTSETVILTPSEITITVVPVTETTPTTTTLLTSPTHDQPLPLNEPVICIDSTTEPLQTKVTEELETTTEFTSTTQLNVTSTVSNQTNVDECATTAPITSPINTCISSTITIPTSPISSVPTTPLMRTPINVETLNYTESTESTTSSPKTDCITDLTNTSETAISTPSEITTTVELVTEKTTTTLLTSPTHNQPLPLNEPVICIDSTTEPIQTKVTEELETTIEFTSTTQVNVTSTVNNQTNVDECATTAPITSPINTCSSSTITIPTSPISSVITTPLMRTPMNVENLNDIESDELANLSLPSNCETYIIIYNNMYFNGTNISTISEITTAVEPVTETTPITTILSTTLSTAYSTTTPSNTISTQSTSNSTAPIYPELREKITEHKCSRKATPELSSTAEMSSTTEELSTIKTTQSTTTETIKSTTETTLTPQIIETTTISSTNIQPSLPNETIIYTDSITEPINTKVTEELETTIEFTSTTQVNVTSTTINQTNVEDTTSTPIAKLTLNTTCSNYPEDCNRPFTWETTAEGETRDFYQILKQRFGNRVKLLRDTTHWPRRSALNIGGKKKSFFIDRHNYIEN